LVLYFRGYGDGTGRGDNGNEMGNYLSFVELGTGLTPSQAFAARSNLCCVLMTNNEMKCWGYNINGQLGFLLFI